MKEILRKPSDEVRWDKLKLLCEVVRVEIEREEDVFLNSEDDIEKLAAAVEACQSEYYGDEVGLGFKSVPEGSRLQLGMYEKGASVQNVRLQTAALVRSVQVGNAISVKMRPMGTIRRPPLDAFGNKLMERVARRKESPFLSLERIADGRSASAMRDFILVALWDALFLTACEHWTNQPQKVTNTTAAEALELGWWVHRGQEIGREPLFNGICVASSVA